jgi:hypothetical protein
MHIFHYIFHDIVCDVERLEALLDEPGNIVSGKHYKRHWDCKKRMIYESIDEICSQWYRIYLTEKEFEWVFKKVIQTPAGISFMFGAGIDPYF